MTLGTKPGATEAGSPHELDRQEGASQESAEGHSPATVPLRFCILNHENQ